MARPRTDEKDPLRCLLRLWGRGEDVAPEHQPHGLALAREATREADALDFGPFERVAAAMVVRLYARSLASADAITCARCLGEVVRSLRALRLLNTASRLRGGQVRSRRDDSGQGFRPPAKPKGRRRAGVVFAPPRGGAPGGPGAAEVEEGDEAAPAGSGGVETGDLGNDVNEDNGRECGGR